MKTSLLILTTALIAGAVDAASAVDAVGAVGASEAEEAVVQMAAGRRRRRWWSRRRRAYVPPPPTPWPTPHPTPVQSCAPGQKLAGNHAGCNACPTGQFKTGNGNPTECTSWRTCPAGQGSTNVPSATTDLVCEHCTSADKKFSDRPDDSPCDSHLVCPRGEGSNWRHLADGGIYTNSQCNTCNGNTFSDVSDYGSCKIKMTCLAGEEYSHGNKYTDASCPPCPSSAFRAENSHRESTCVPKRSCPKGQYLIPSGDVIQDDTCASCDAGTEQLSDTNFAGIESCTPCGVGMFSAVPGADCADCDAKPLANSDWVQELGNSQQDCEWDCSTDYTLTHNDKQCGKAGSVLTMKAGSVLSPIQASFTMHSNGYLSLASDPGDDSV